MKVLSTKQPWSYLLCAGAKDIENRTWKLPEKYKGERVLIHASSSRLDDFPELKLTQEQINQVDIFDYFENINKLRAIIGSVRFVDYTINHPSIWAEKTRYMSEETFYDQVPNGFDKWENDFKDNLVNKKDVIYNWVVEDSILFKQPITNVKGKLSFWDYGHPYHCPDCGYPLHLQYSGGGVTDAFCFQCGKDIEITKMVK